jgi:predicted nuclease of predicted toxin-antitoxin system
MRFLADENFPGLTVAALRAAGHDIVWVRAAKSGATDLEVLQWAMQEKRSLLTFDKDFGELAARTMLSAECGIVLVRTPMPKLGDVAQRRANSISSREDWAGHFSVVEPSRVRMRRLA